MNLYCVYYHIGRVSLFYVPSYNLGTLGIYRWPSEFRALLSYTGQAAYSPVSQAAGDSLHVHEYGQLYVSMWSSNDIFRGSST